MAHIISAEWKQHERVADGRADIEVLPAAAHQYLLFRLQFYNPVPFAILFPFAMLFAFVMFMFPSLFPAAPHLYLDLSPWKDNYIDVLKNK